MNEFKTYSKKLYDLSIITNKKREQYDSLKVSAGCRMCDRYSHEITIFDNSRHVDCNLGAKCEKVKRAYDVYYEARSNEQEFRNRYAEVIFNELSATKPELIVRKDDSTVKWTDAFGTDFAKLEEPLKDSLVALIEEDGGRYRIKQ